jgi:hypothetical protein
VFQSYSRDAIVAKEVELKLLGANVVYEKD